ncbi:MAG TPA: hypothetical protein VHC90_07125 [Bryobacteraceae bacterium]|nr:hypothetical protein [Bryobacteraceae bacterium]
MRAFFAVAVFAGVATPHAFGDIMLNGVDFQHVAAWDDTDGIELIVAANSFLADPDNPGFYEIEAGALEDLYVIASPIPWFHTLDPGIDLASYGVSPTSDTALDLLPTAGSIGLGGVTTGNSQWTEVDGLSCAACVEIFSPGSVYNASTTFSTIVPLNAVAQVGSLGTAGLPIAPGQGIYLNFYPTDDLGNPLPVAPVAQLFLGESLPDQYGDSVGVGYFETGSAVLSESSSAPEPNVGLLLLSGLGVLGLLQYRRQRAGSGDGLLRRFVTHPAARL